MPIKLSEIRAKFPMYADVPDEQLVIGMHRKFYSDLPFKDFNAQIQYDNAPNPSGSFLENVAAGAGKFASDTGTGIKQLLNDSAAGLEGVMPESVQRGGQWLNRNLGMGDAKDIQARGREDIAETRRLDAPLMKTGGGNVGYALGGIATAPLLPATTSVGGAAAAGSALGFLQPSLDWKERGVNTALGGVVGGAGQVAANGLARMVRPNTSPEVQALMREGVTPTPGQALGGAFKRVEDGLTSVPIAGDFIKQGQRNSFRDVNRAAFNRALAPIGQTLPRGVEGREAVELVGDRLGAEYARLLPQMTTQADQQFAQGIGQLRASVNTGAIDPNAAAAFERILQNDVIGKFQGQGAVTGQTLKQIESDLGQQIRRLAQSTDADQRLVGDGLRQVQDELRNLVMRTNPQHARELRAINTGYANFKRVQRAAAGLGAEDGIFSPAQLQNAVKALDRSKDKARFADGNALMQDLSETAKTALGQKVPDSGTPYRLAAMSGGAGLAALLGSPGTAAALAAAPVMYSRPGQALMAAALTQRPQAANRLAELIRLSGPAAGMGGAALAVQK